jgi:signal transduction histidine kinase
VRALGVVLGGAALHLVLAHILLTLLTPHRAPADLHGAVSLVVASTALVALGLLYLRTQSSSPDHVARSIPKVWWWTPPVASALFLPASLSADLLSSPVSLTVASTATLVSASWSAALVVALVGTRMLRALAVRYPPLSAEGAMHTLAPPTLAISHARLLATAASCSTLIATGAVLGNFPTVGPVGFWILVASTVGLAAIAGSSMGQTPGDDVVSIARRLDASGYGSRDALTGPIVVTRFDEVGDLLARLEQLRGQLEQEMRLYEQALDKTKAADALKADFLSAVSHELRTPLNVVGGFAQLLLEGVPSPLTESQTEDVRLIQAGGKQLLELINDILDISMIESGELRLSFQACNIGDLIQEVIQIHQPLVRDQPYSLEMKLDPELPSIVCDRRRLTQILTNLVSNAIKFTEEGSITVEAAYDVRVDGVVLRCIDTGVGIEATELDTVFEEYRQVGALKRRKRGTGLGLAIARKIAQHHGGSLTVESTPGRGSIFTLALPLDPPGRPDAIAIAPRVTPAGGIGNRSAPTPQQGVAS